MTFLPVLFIAKKTGICYYLIVIFAFNCRKGADVMVKKEQLYEGKAKKVFATDDPELYIVEYKDDATAFNGLKKGTISGKGVINNRVSNYLMQKFTEATGLETHFVKELSDRETLVRKVSIVPLEIIIRNIAAGSMSKRLGIPEGTALKCPVLEFCLKDDELGDPFINEYVIKALDIADDAQLATITDIAFKVNDFLKAYLLNIGIELVDFKIEIGKKSDGSLILADEISPDTCRFWDVKTHEKLDKDRFRRDMGGVEDAYTEIRRRILGD